MPAAISFLQAASNTSDLTAYTFSAQNLGVAASDRYIIVAVGGRRAGSVGSTISSVTVGGVAATIVVQRSNAVTNSDVTGLVIAAVPTGTSGDVVVTFADAMLRCSIALWRATGINATAFDTDSSIANDPGVTISVEAGGYIIASAVAGNTATATWTGVTERFDQQVETLAHSGGEAASATTQNVAVSCNWTSSNEDAGVFASFSEGGASPQTFSPLVAIIAIVAATPVFLPGIVSFAPAVAIVSGVAAAATFVGGAFIWSVASAIVSVVAATVVFFDPAQQGSNTFRRPFFQRRRVF